MALIDPAFGIDALIRFAFSLKQVKSWITDITVFVSTDRALRAVVDGAIDAYQVVQGADSLVTTADLRIISCRYDQD